MARQILFVLLFSLAALAHAQTDRQLVREGNRLFNKQKYDKAEVQYRKAVEQNPSNPQAVYNLGCALMMQNKDSAAIVQYERATTLEKNKLRLASAYHNIGVICQNHKMYAEAITAYQQSLRNNPKDDETRYNLALCKRMQKDNNKGKNDKKDENKENENNNSQQNKEKNNDKDKGEEKQRQQQEQMSKENAEQLINAAIQNEKATQQRLKKAMQQPGKRKISDKNW